MSFFWLVGGFLAGLWSVLAVAEYAPLVAAGVALLAGVVAPSLWRLLRPPRSVRAGAATGGGAPAEYVVVVPPGGIDAYPAPDPAAPHSPLAAGSQLRLIARSGGWVQLQHPTGAMLWVDAQRLWPGVPGPPGR